MGWKSDKDGNHYNDKRKRRDTGSGTEVNIEVDNNSDDFAEGVKKDFTEEKIHALKLALYDADRRYEIAISRMSEITNRLHELEIARNLALRKQYLENEIKKNHDPNLIKEYNGIDADDRDIFTYQEVAQGYSSLSRRKNELQEERNQYVKEIEELERRES